MATSQRAILLRLGEALQFSLTAVSLTLLARAGCRRPVTVFFAGLLVGFAFEALGTRTGIPFGVYTYEWRAPSLLGVPLTVVYGWGLYVTVSYMVASRFGSMLQRVLYASLLTTSLDMAIDPVMVSYGFWRWARAGEWFGIPLENFAGWFTVSAASLLLAERIAKAGGSCPLSWRCSALCYLTAYIPFAVASKPETITPVLVAATLGTLLVVAPQLARRMSQPSGGVSR
ncbi:MAG: carotenoid biosynthesis protein [Thermofilum sp.]